MRFRNTAILGGILIVLAAYFYFFEAKKDTQPAAEKVFTISRDDITRIKVTTNDETTIAEKIPREGWYIVDPLKFPADPAALGEIVNEFISLSPARTVVDSAANLSEYGLDPPAAIVEISAGLKSPGTLLLGDANPTRSSYYAVAKGSRRVFLVANEINNKFHKTTTDLRDRKLVHVDRDKVSQVSVRSNKTPDPLTCELDSLNIWRLVSPFKLPAEKNETINLIANIAGLKAFSFVEDNPRSLQTYGLQQPVTVATLKSRDGSIDATVSFGKTENDRVYAMSNEHNTVFAVGAAMFDQIVRDPDLYRRSTAFDFRSYQVSKLDFSFGPELVTCVKRSFEDWRLLKPIETRADDKILTSLLDSLEVMKIKQYIEATPSNLKKYGLEDARVKITCSFQDKPYPDQILLGNLSDDGRSIYVQDGREDWIYAVNSTGFLHLPATATDLRDRKVLRFKGYEVNMFEMITSNNRIRIRRDQKQKTVWKIEEPSNQDADAIAVGEAFSALDSVYTEIFVSDDEGANLPQYGLDKPVLEITLLIGGRNDVPEERLSLLVGKLFPGDANLVYVKRRDSPTVSLVKVKFLKVLNRLITNTSPKS